MLACARTHTLTRAHIKQRHLENLYILIAILPNLLHFLYFHYFSCILGSRGSKGSLVESSLICEKLHLFRGFIFELLLLVMLSLNIFLEGLDVFLELQALLAFAQISR